MRIQNAYNNWSEIYDCNKNKTRDLDQKVTKEILSKISFESVLELGCGTGKNTHFLVHQAKQVVAVDFSQGMLEVAKAKINSIKVSFHQADITQNWDFTNEKFDLLMCNLILEHIENLNFIFQQAQQKLQKNGKFFISELHPFKQYLGTKARYETENGIEELEVYTHHISDFTNAALHNGFKIIEINEWWHEEDEKSLPRIVTFLFQKVL